MLIIPPPKRPAKRKFEPSVATVQPALALTLVAAGYDPVGLVVVLTFDRPVDVDAFDGTQVTLYDGPTNHAKYTGGAATLTGSMGVSVALVAVAGTIHGSVVEVIATGTTGITAVDDGGLWAGTGGIGLPFSE